MKYGHYLFQTERHSNQIRLISLQADLLLTHGQWMNSQVLHWYNHGTTVHQTSLTVIDVGLCVTLWSKSQLSNTALTQPRNDSTPNSLTAILTSLWITLRSMTNSQTLLSYLYWKHNRQGLGIPNVVNLHHDKQSLPLPVIFRALPSWNEDAPIVTDFSEAMSIMHQLLH